MPNTSIDKAIMLPPQSEETRRLVLNLTREESPSEDERPRAPRAIMSLGIGACAVAVMVMFTSADPSALFRSWQRHEEPASPKAPETPPPRVSDTGLDASGYVVARRLATVTAEVSGRIDEISVEPGAFVHRGDVLAELDGAIASTQVAQAAAQTASVRKSSAAVKTELEQALRELETTRNLADRGIMSRSQLDEATSEVAALRARLEVTQSDLEVARTQLQLQKQQLQNTRILAPFDGVILDLHAHVGEVLSPLSAVGQGGAGICTIMDPKSLEGEVDISEQHLGRVAVGQRVEVRAPAYPDLRVSGRVAHITGAVERNTAAVKLRIAFETNDRLIPGMRIDVHFEPLDPPRP